MAVTLQLMARHRTNLGHDEEAKILNERGHNWKNIINPATGLAEGRSDAGRGLLAAHLDRYAADATALPRAHLETAIAEVGHSPAAAGGGPRQPRRVWRRYFEGWIATPDPMGAVLARRSIRKSVRNAASIPSTAAKP